MRRLRLDILLVKKGISVSRQKAKSLIMAGFVFVENVLCDKPGSLFGRYVNITLKNSRMKYVSRGGVKLESALKKNLVNCVGKTCIDVGASTGGFTDCLLDHGAYKVFSIDVGYGQLAWKLRQDSRVIVMERTNIRYVNKNLFPCNIDIITIDVSFISLRIVIPCVVPFLSKDGIIIALIKPQFEVGKKNVGKNGVVKSPLLHKEVIKNLESTFNGMGLNCKKVIRSPLLGPKGNKEFFIFIEKNSLL